MRGIGIRGAGMIPIAMQGGAQGLAINRWWLSGGIDPANCIAAYQPIGAPSLAASYINLANPGTNNAAPGVAPILVPNGWYFDGITTYLTTGVIPTTNTTMIVAFEGFMHINRSIAGMQKDSTDAYIIKPAKGDGNREYKNHGARTIAGEVITGVMGVAGKQGYLNGVSDGAAIAAGDLVPGGFDIWIGSGNVAGVSASVAVTIKAFAIYSTPLTAPQMLAVTNAMNAITFSGDHAVMVCFDDGYDSDHNIAYPIMDAFGIPGTTFIPTYRIDTVDRVTAAMLQTLNADGWSIGNHTDTHLELDVAEVAVGIADIEAATTILDGLGLTDASLILAYPSGKYGGNAIAAATGAGIILARTTVAEGFDNGVNILEVPSLYVMKNNHTATVAGWVASEMAAHKYVSLLFHRLLATPETDWQYSTSEFTVLMYFLASCGARLINYKDLYDELTA